jgi:hypothetical protein
MPIRGETIIIDRLQTGYERGLVSDESASEQEVGLLLERNGRLCVLHENPIEKPATFELGLRQRLGGCAEERVAYCVFVSII